VRAPFRQLAAARNSRQNRSQKGKSDSVSIDIFISIPILAKEVSKKDEEVMAKSKFALAPNHAMWCCLIER
jgi:hypothetical protein